MHMNNSGNGNDNGFHFQSIFEQLEDRVLFDGVPDATFFVLPENDAQPVPAQIESVQQGDVEGPRELIFIDAGVENSEQLLAGILEEKPDSNLEIRFLDASQDGVSQITDTLSSAKGKYDAIHIISHGDEGEIQLGNSWLDEDSLAANANAIASWSDALTDDADLLFYGCNLAGNEAGESFIESMAALTGADVAASEDLTGAAELGGDWDLELNVGTIETQAFAATAFSGVLLDTDGDGVDDQDDLDDDNDGILDVDEGLGASAGQFTHQNFKEFRTDAVFGFATANAFNGQIIVADADDPNNDHEVDLEVGDVVVYSMNDGADLVAVTVLSITDGAQVNAETTRPGESPKIEFRGDGDYGGEEERLRLEFVFFDPADADFASAADLGDVAALIRAGNGTAVEQTTSIRLGDVDDTTGSNDSAFRIEGVGADLSTLHSYTLEDGGSFTPEIEGDGFVRFRGTVNDPDDDIQFNYLNTGQFEVELLNDADRTAGFGFGFRQSNFSNPITTAENGTDSDNDGIADHLDLDLSLIHI